MIEKIGIFVLFLFPLVFFHELGHFFFAKLFGVRVETFSIGFGPKLFKFRIGETQYCISLIPFGGYVKMYGENILDKENIPEDRQNFSLVFKSKWERFWIVFGGPLFNFIFAFCIYFFLAAGGEKLPEVKFGVLGENSILYTKGIRTADTLSKINGINIESPTDIEVDESSKINKISVLRNGAEVPLTIGMTGAEFFAEFQKAPALFHLPVIVNEKNEKFVVSLSTNSVNWMQSIEEIANKTNKTFYLFKVKNLEGQIADLTAKQVISGKDFYDALFKNSLHPLDLVVDDLTEDSAARVAGMMKNDLVVAIDGKPIQSFDDLRSEVNSDKKTLNVTVIRNGEKVPLSISPKVVHFEGAMRKMIGVQSSAVFLPPSYRTLPAKGIFESVGVAFVRTGDAISKTMSGFAKLISREVSFKNVGGPLLIGKYATDTFKMSFSFFMQFMAIVSVNLALINLFPIPILDGGHILFIILEFINRGPLSNRKIEIAQQVGLSLLLLLMVSAIFNDVTRFF